VRRVRGDIDSSYSVLVLLSTEVLKHFDFYTKTKSRY